MSLAERVPLCKGRHFIPFHSIWVEIRSRTMRLEVIDMAGRGEDGSVRRRILAKFAAAGSARPERTVVDI